MTPDLLAGLFIGSFAVYACWLLSLRLAEEPPVEWIGGPGFGWIDENGEAHVYYEDLKEPRGSLGPTGDSEIPLHDPLAAQAAIASRLHYRDPNERITDPEDAIGDALVLLDKAFSDHGVMGRGDHQGPLPANLPDD